LTEVHVGDILISSGSIFGTVKTITSNVALTLTLGSLANLGSAAYSADPMVNVESLGAAPSAPKGDYQPWAVSMPTGDALARGLGRPLAQWRWNAGPTDFFPLTVRDALRTYCTGKSARVYIRTRTFESADSFRTFQAAMLWPDKEDRDSRGTRKGFVIEFRDLIPL
jgi:hypothetical protein